MPITENGYNWKWLQCIVQPKVVAMKNGSKWSQPEMVELENGFNQK